MLQLPTEGDRSAFKSNHRVVIGPFQNLPHRQVLSLTNYNSITTLLQWPPPPPPIHVWCVELAVVSVHRVCQYLHYHILYFPCKEQTPLARKFICVKIIVKKNRADVCLLYIWCVSNYFCEVAAGWLCVSNDRRTPNDNQCQKSILKWIDSVSQIPTIQIIQKYITHHIQIYWRWEQNF